LRCRCGRRGRREDLRPGNQLEILVATIIISVLRDEHTVGEGRSQSGSTHVNAVRVADIIDAIAGNDCKSLDIWMWFGPIVYNKRVTSLARRDKVAAATRLLGNRQPFNVRGQVTSCPGSIDEAAHLTIGGLGTVLPDANGFLADVDNLPLIIRDTGFCLRSEDERAYQRRVDQAGPIVEQVPLLDQAIRLTSAKVVKSP
jgi:hypothetical protein